MAQDPREVGAERLEPDQEKSAEQLRAEIEETREELGDTVEALAAKTDVKAQTQRKVAEVRRSIDAKRSELMGKARGATPDGASSAAGTVQQKARENPVPVALAGAFAAGLIFGRITKR